MYKKTFACFATLLAMGMAHASGVPCNGFEIKIKNNTPDDFIANKVELKGADLQPGNFQKINAHTEQVFTVNKSLADAKMEGSFELHSVSIPSKKISIQYDLRNKDLICYHDDKGASGDYSVEKSRSPGNVTYTVGS